MTVKTYYKILNFYFLKFYSRGHESNTAWVFAAGGLSGIVSWVFTYPQDVIKSRIQADDICPKNRAYRNAYHCLKVSIYMTNMPKSLNVFMTKKSITFFHETVKLFGYSRQFK